MSFTRRIVIDTGVLVSAALRPQSVPALALEKALLYFDVCTSIATTAELASVLMRSKFDAYCTSASRQAFIDGYIAHTKSFEITQSVNDCSDPNDNKFLELALASDAELIVSSDAHLTTIHPWRNIAIMPPSAFLVGVH